MVRYDGQGARRSRRARRRSRRAPRGDSVRVNIQQIRGWRGEVGKDDDDYIQGLHRYTATSSQAPTRNPQRANSSHLATWCLHTRLSVLQRFGRPATHKCREHRLASKHAHTRQAGSLCNLELCPAVNPRSLRRLRSAGTLPRDSAGLICQTPCMDGASPAVTRAHAAGKGSRASSSLGVRVQGGASFRRDLIRGKEEKATAAAVEGGVSGHAGKQGMLSVWVCGWTHRVKHQYGALPACWAAWPRSRGPSLCAQATCAAQLSVVKAAL